MRTLDLVIFDCDGVLVDSERIANEVFASVLNEACGFSLTLQDMFTTFVGHSSAQCMAIVEDMMGAPPPAGLAERYRREINAALAARVESVDGVEQVLDDLSVPACVASSGTHDKMRTTLGRTGLLPRFEGRLFSTSDVARPKPHPDVFLHAATRMACADPGSCLVIEDSPMGVRGGVAAGMTVFGYAELTDPGHLRAAGAAQTFTSMAELPELIAQYFNV